MTQDDYTGQTARWMKQLQDDPALKSRELPDPDLLWMKAELLERQARLSKELAPVDRLDTGMRVVIGCAVCWIALNLIAMWAGAFAGHIPPVWISLAISVGISIVAMAAYPVWAGE